MKLALASRRTRLVEPACLAAILTTAAALRFANLSSRGLIYWDEAKFALEGQRFFAYLRDMAGGAAPVTMGKSIGTAKPTHALFIALSYAVGGVHSATPLFMDATFSVISVGLVYLLGRRLFGVMAGLLAALIMAVSEYDVIYARSALSESDATALFLLAVLLWLRDRDSKVESSHASGFRRARWLLLSGLVAGAAFTANYRMVAYILALAAFDLGWTVKTGGWREAGRRLAAFGLAAGCSRGLAGG